MPRPKALRHDDALRALNLAKAQGYEVAALDVRTDGVTVHFVPPGSKTGGEGTAFDRWLASQDEGRERPAHSRQ